MHHDVVHARGEAAPSRLLPGGVFGDPQACRDEATAAKGPLADPASKPFRSHGEPLGGIEFGARPGTALTYDAARVLLAAVVSGNRWALSRLYLLYFPQLVKFFGHLMATASINVIEELITETMFRVWRHHATLAAQMSAHVWIMHIAYRCGRERLASDDRLHRSSTKPSLRSPQAADCRSSNPDPPRTLHEVLGTLRMTQRAVVHLVYSGHSPQEVADILTMSRESVDVHLASSMVALHPWLAARAMNVSESA